MESRHLFDRRYSPRPRRLPHQSQQRGPRHSHLLNSQQQSFGLYDMFAQMSLTDDVSNGNVDSSPVRFNNLVPKSDLGIFESSSVRVDHLLYQNFGKLHGDFGSFYQSEFDRIQLFSPPYQDGVSLGRGRNRLVANGNINVGSEVSLMDFKGQIFALATDQVGCKMLQMKFGDIKDEEIKMIFDEVVDSLSSLMMDQFGIYLVQKLIEVCSEEQMTCIVHSVTKNPYQLISVCLNPHGTRAVQKLIESIKTTQQISMVISALSPGIVELIKDGNAHHLIQHCLKHFPDEHSKFLVNEIARNCYEIATDKSGCCVLQICVDIARGQVKDHLINKIVAAALPLSEDCYGNYVVQQLLLLKVPNVTAKVLNELCGHFFSLACNKYGSNVVEKCLIETDEEFSKFVILELLRTPNVSKLLQDPFGNYVFQSALSASQGILHNALVSLVKKNSASMCTNLYGKKVLAWLDGKKRCHMYAKQRY